MFLFQDTHKLLIVLKFLGVLIIHCWWDLLGFSRDELPLKHKIHVVIWIFAVDTLAQIYAFMDDCLTQAALLFRERIYNFAKLHLLQMLEKRNILQKEKYVISLPLLYFGKAFHIVFGWYHSQVAVLYALYPCLSFTMILVNQGKFTEWASLLENGNSFPGLLMLWHVHLSHFLHSF